MLKINLWYLKQALNLYFFKEWMLLKRTEFYSKDQLYSLKLNRLKKICCYAYQHCDYYHDLFNQAALDPQTLKLCEDIKVLPFLTKNVIRDNLAGITAKSAKDYTYVTTGGSTGEPLGFFLERQKTYPRTYAYECRQYHWGSVGLFERRARIRGTVLMNGIAQIDGNILFLSAFHLTTKNAMEYIKKLEEFQPIYIEAYPSSILILAEFIINGNVHVNLPKLKSIFLSSETINEMQKKKIAKAFNSVNVFNKYGNSEQVIMIGQCKYGAMHEFEEYGYAEYLNNDGREIDEGVAQLIGTGFINFATIFIRYKTDDLILLSKKDTCICGRAHKIVDQVIGRTQDYLLGKNGERVTVAAINSHSNAFDGIIGLQYFQERQGEAVIKIIMQAELSENKKAKIIQEASYRSAGLIHFVIEKVDQLEKNYRGKNIYVVRRCNENEP